MRPDIIHLYGPFSIKSFGVFIVIGIILFSTLLLKDRRIKKMMSVDEYFNLLSLAIIASIIGGRLLFLASNWQSLESFSAIFKIWEGGFSLMGAVIALLLVAPFYLKKLKIPIVPFLDVAAIYIPLLQSVSRVGCFFAGCCFGLPTGLWIGVINPSCPIEELAHQPLHPTQLYSAFALFVIFLFMFFYAQYQCKVPGQLACLYLVLSSAERFIIDFWRADREFLHLWLLSSISVPQLLALIIMILSGVTFIYLKLSKKFAPS